MTKSTLASISLPGPLLKINDACLFTGNHGAWAGVRYDNGNDAFGRAIEACMELMGPGVGPAGVRCASANSMLWRA